MSIVDCQNYPREYKPHLCMNCKYYRQKKEPVTKKYGCSGYCVSEEVSESFKYGYKIDGIVYLPVGNNGSCTKYEEAYR